MREIILPGGKAVIERGLLRAAGEQIRGVFTGGRLAVVSDETVWGLYGERVMASLRAAGFSAFFCVIPAGESSKTLARVGWLYDAFLAGGLTRVDGVVALGGGVVGDLAGFAAATIYRGVALFQIPTSLLAQLDSGIGGKTGVDLPQGKNLVGAFYAPRLTLIDPDCLTTLPRRQLCAGAAEAIKCGLIADAALLEKLEQKAPDWETVIADSCAVKAKFVLADEHDHGDRRKLNFGHTLGHVYEAAGGYQRWYHGEAVAAGMAAMLRIEEKNDAAAGALRERVEKLLQAYGLPTRISCTAAEYRRYLAVDKKCSGGDITVVTVRSAGAAQVHTLPVSALLQQLEESDGH